MAFIGLEKASKPALQELVKLLGDDLTGNGDVSMTSSKAELVVVIEEYVNNMMENSDFLENKWQDVSADIGHRYRGIINSRLKTNKQAPSKHKCISFDNFTLFWLFQNIKKSY